MSDPNEPKLWNGIPGWGVDLDPDSRPGVPMEREPHKAPGAHWIRPEQQRSDVPVLKRAELEGLTPVFGTGQPPYGVSGAMRRFAYSIPQHKAAHWMTLLLADRVDVIESELRERFERSPRRSIALAATLLSGAVLLPPVAARVVRRRLAA